MSRIRGIFARQILDSRGYPTIEADCWTESNKFGRAAVPSGASTGTREALELRDGNMHVFLGKSVLQAVSNVNSIISKHVVGMNVFDQKKIDQVMLDLDGTPFKKKLGANAILAVSMAVVRAASQEAQKPLFRYLYENLKIPTANGKMRLPNPLMNIINGGKHASNNLDIQEFMIVPHMKKSFSENLRAGVEVFHHLKKVLNSYHFSTNVGDEGGFAPDLKSHEDALNLIMESISKAGYRPGEDISLALDAAASEFFERGCYKMQGQEFTTDQMINYYLRLIKNYPIYSIEDGLAEGDVSGWTKMNSALGKDVTLVGDDLFVTNKAILREGIEKKQANSILIKVNQIGTLTETFETMELAYDNNLKCIISHRSGETGDSFIADLAVASGSGHIKTGSASRSDRMEKYNELLRIEEQLGSLAIYDPVK